MNLEFYKTANGPGQGSDGSPAPNCRDGQTPYSFTVGGGKAPRLDAFLGEALRCAGISREKIKLAIREGMVARNGEPCRKPNTLLASGDEITAHIAPPQSHIAAEHDDLTVLWHDEYLAVINKPANLTVHPAPGQPQGTLAHRLVHHFPEIAAQGGLRPGIVHRLDKDTSGLMLVALTEKARLAMSGAFAERTVKKHYLALVHGVPAKRAGSITKPLGRSPSNKTKMAVVPLAKGGKEAHSDYEVLYAAPTGAFSLVNVAIHTGRTHQIRVHMQDAGHPLIGDAVYKVAAFAPLPRAVAPRQMLHAWRLAFTHPVTGAALSFCTEPPEDFVQTAAHLACPMQRVVVTGSAGGGKSTLTKLLRESGIPAWSADDAVRRQYEPGSDGWFVLKRKYGERLVPDERKAVDKQALLALMEESRETRREVEETIHPIVRNDLAMFWDSNEKANAPVAVAEIPLFLESGWRDGEKRTAISGGKNGLPAREILVGVYSPFAARRERIIATRGWDDGKIAAVESWQWPEDKKIRAADIVVDNSGTLDDLKQRAKAAIHALAFLRDQARKRAATTLARLWRCPPGD